MGCIVVSAVSGTLGVVFVVDMMGWGVEGGFVDNGMLMYMNNLVFVTGLAAAKIMGLVG